MNDRYALLPVRTADALYDALEARYRRARAILEALPADHMAYAPTLKRAEDMQGAMSRIMLSSLEATQDATAYAVVFQPDELAEAIMSASVSRAVSARTAEHDNAATLAHAVDILSTVEVPA